MDRKNGNWTIKNTEKIFANEFFKIHQDDVVRPDGKQSKYATIDIKPGVAILPIDDQGFVYLTCQFRYAIGRHNIECIGGTVEDEEIISDAKRETREELGISAGEWISAGKIEVITAITNSHSYLFLAHKLSFGKPETEGSEEIELVKIKLDEAFEKVMKGEITHGETCVIILKAYAQK